MMLGKRQRPPMKRTTSMTEFTLDTVFSDMDSSRPFDQSQHQVAAQQPDWMRHMGPTGSMLSPRGRQRRNSSDFYVETASFLKSCGMCNRQLAPGRDIFMYRGEIAFCSLECRQHQMNQDELREKCGIKSMAQTVNTGSDQSGTGETMAAA
ncbi:hypothetical protein LUZ60_003039 [Juncus effusus]|nr:hypothetical protein LUZ60_003039 [Juncus effusus]